MPVSSFPLFFIKHLSLPTSTLYARSLLHRHDLWYFDDLDMASLHRVVADPDTIVTHDACRARKQALPDFMLVNPRAAGRLVEAAGHVQYRQTKRRGQCPVSGPAAGAGLKVRRVGVGTPAYSHVDRSGLPSWTVPLSETMKVAPDSLAHPSDGTHAPLPAIAEAAHFSDVPGMTPGGSWDMCVNDIGAWDVKAV